VLKKRSVAIAIHDDAQPGRVLVVQRPADDEDLPDAWGLPAASLGPDESWEDAVLRAGREKLGVEFAIDGELSRGSLQRATYVLEMRLFAAHIAAGLPHVPQPGTGVTQYQAWRWAEPAVLRPAAEQGSLCSRLYLQSLSTGA
jgi:8-oxo-dGTP diphosphatase